MMKWFWAWRLRVANDRCRKASHALPENFMDNIEGNERVIVEFIIATSAVVELTEKVESYRRIL